MTKLRINRQKTSSYLVKGVVGVLKDVAGVVPKLLTNGDEVHGDEKQGEGEEANDALPPDSLQRRHVVLGHELLLVDQLQRHDDLRPHNEDVTEQNVGGGLVGLCDIPRVVAAAVEDVTDANGEEADNDKEDPDPLVAEESLL